MTAGIISEMEKAIHRSDIRGLKSIINSIDSVDYSHYSEKYNEIYKFSKSLVRDTIIWSIWTTVIIIFCISIIPFSDNFLCRLRTLNIIYYIVISCITISFIGLLSILIKSLMETGKPIFELKKGKLKSK